MANKRTKAGQMPTMKSPTVGKNSPQSPPSVVRRHPASPKSPEQVIEVFHESFRQKKRQWISSTCVPSPLPKRRTSSLGNNAHHRSQSVPSAHYEELVKRYEDLEIDYALLVRQLETKDLRIEELEATILDMEKKMQEQAQKSRERIEEMQAQVKALMTANDRLVQELTRAEAFEPQLNEAQVHMEKMYDVMMDMEYEMVRLREDMISGASNTSKSQYHAIQRELSHLKKRRCVSQSKWLFENGEEVADDEEYDANTKKRRCVSQSTWVFEDDETGDEMEDPTDYYIFDEDTSSASMTTPFPVAEIDFLDLAQQVVAYAAQKTSAHLALWTEMETQLQNDSCHFQDSLAAENAQAIKPTERYTSQEMDAWEQLELEIDVLLVPPVHPAPHW
ncbi:hypothetical protein LEN26_017100 [Aphanomyces euteiches]|nr:hypothetical protein LEN26_017100 [Aphanomyces euteiches]